MEVLLEKFTFMQLLVIKRDKLKTCQSTAWHAINARLITQSLMIQSHEVQQFADAKCTILAERQA